VRSNCSWVDNVHSAVLALEKSCLLPLVQLHGHGRAQNAQVCHLHFFPGVRMKKLSSAG
jgi:hypothetical protein